VCVCLLACWFVLCVLCVCVGVCCVVCVVVCVVGCVCVCLGVCVGVCVCVCTRRGGVICKHMLVRIERYYNS